MKLWIWTNELGSKVERKQFFSKSDPVLLWIKWRIAAYNTVWLAIEFQFHHRYIEFFMSVSIALIGIMPLLLYVNLLRTMSQSTKLEWNIAVYHESYDFSDVFNSKREKERSRRRFYSEFIGLSDASQDLALILLKCLA